MSAAPEAGEAPTRARPLRGTIVPPAGTHLAHDELPTPELLRKRGESLRASRTRCSSRALLVRHDEPTCGERSE